MSEHRRAAGVRREEGSQYAHEGGLAGAVGAQQPHDGSFGHGDVYAGERAHVAEGLLDVLGDYRVRRGALAARPGR